jgi:hypothetical protein
VRQRDILAWGALAMAIVGTASAEYGLADAAGWGRVAFALPGTLDIYVVRALRAHRDMAAAVVAMILVNAVAHLISAGLLPVSVPVVVGVSAIAPLVLWRVHALRETPPEAEAEPMEAHFRTAAELTETPDEPQAPQPQHSPEPVTLERVAEVEETGGNFPPAPTLGPLVPVAELLAVPAAVHRPEPVDLLTVADVAKTMGVAEGTVRSWVSRNKLTPAQRDDNGRLLFHPDTVAALA